MNITRRGKIARLPETLRRQLNQRLMDGEAGPDAVAWLNSLPEVQSVLAAEFADNAITEKNLSDWRVGGYQDWLDQQQAVEMLRQMSSEAKEFNAAANGAVTDRIALWLAGRYLIAAQKEMDASHGELNWQRLRELCQDILRLRQSDCAAQRVKIDQERLEIVLRHELD